MGNYYCKSENQDILYYTVPGYLHKCMLCQGGINDDRIKLALEPEAASIWCQQMDERKKHALTKTGSKCMVADIGGAYLKC